LENKFLGLYLPDEIRLAIQRALEYRKAFGESIRILSFYSAWGSGKNRPDLSGIEEILKSGFIPMITWESWCLPRDLPENIPPQDQPNFSLSKILKGRYDDYVRRWALDLKEVSAPFFFRPLHEMNGNWYPWCGKVNRNSPEQYKATWHYLRSIFQDVQNDRLIWVWSPYAHSVPNEPGNEIWRYYPGPEGVDWLALDGYNWGRSRDGSRWQGFKEIFGKAYEELVQIAPQKPMMIAEAGCTEERGNKGEWIEEAFQTLGERFPKIMALVWFNTQKECDWRLESSRESLSSFRKNGMNWTNC
jgi:hypothetical protein